MKWITILLFCCLPQTQWASVQYKGVPCEEQANSSFLLMVTEDGQVLNSSHWSPDLYTHLSYNSPVFIMKAYNEISRKGQSSSHFITYTPCGAASQLSEFLSQEHPLIQDVTEDATQDPGSEGQGQMPNASTGSCGVLEAETIALALADIQHSQSKGKLLLMYTDEFLPVLYEIGRLEVGGEPMVTWSFGDHVEESSLKQLSSFASMETINQGSFIVLVGEGAFDIIDWAHRQLLTSGDHIWIFAVHGNLESWKSRIVPGEKIIFLDISRNHEECYVSQTAYDNKIHGVNSSYLLWILSLETGQFKEIGSWSVSTGLDLLHEDIWHFTHFKEKFYTVASLPWPVFHYPVFDEDGTEIRWGGICIEILNGLAESLNFTYKVVVPADMSWGAPVNAAVPLGPWNGMVSMVLRGEADFAVAKFTITNLRESVADFAEPFWQEPIVMAMRKPDENSLLIYLGPFQYWFWISILCAVIFMGIAIAIAGVLRGMIYEGTSILRRISFIQHVYVSMWFTYGAILQQGCYWVPESQALRFFVGFWWFFCLVCVATYTGNLIAVLAVPKMVLPVNTLQDLADQTFYKYGVVDQTALFNMFETSKIKLYQRLFDQSIQYQENLVLSHTAGLAKAAEENYIYMGELGGVAPVVYNNCIYALAKEQFYPSSFGFVFPTNSPILPYVDKVLVAMKENGMIDKWRTAYYPRDMCSLLADGGKPDAMTIQDIQGALMLLGIGVIGAGVILTLEWAYRWLCFKYWGYKTKNIKNNNNKISNGGVIMKQETRSWR